MSQNPIQPESRCPQCGAALKPPVERCWLCGAAVGAMQDAPQAAADELVACEIVREVERRTRFQFSLATILVLITLTAVVLSIWQMEPGVGIAVAIVTAPAFIWTCVRTLREEAKGKHVSWKRRATTFVVTWFIVAAIVIGGTVGLAFWIIFLVCGHGL